MKKYTLIAITIILFFLSSNWLYAQGYIGNVTVKRMRVHAQSVYFGTSIQPTDTCSNFGEYFKFTYANADGTVTPEGKAWLSTLTAAKLANKPISIWYNPSTASGTTYDTGCTDAAVATVIIISID